MPKSNVSGPGTCRPISINLAPASILLTYIHLIIFFFFWSCGEACRILVPRPGIEPVPSAVKALSPNHWTARKFPTETVSITIITYSLYPKITDSKETANS